MMFSYEVSDAPAMARIFYDGKIIDTVGPWDTVESAQIWAESYVNLKNAGLE